MVSLGATFSNGWLLCWFVSMCLNEVHINYIFVFFLSATVIICIQIDCDSHLPLVTTCLPACEATSRKRSGDRTYIQQLYTQRIGRQHQLLFVRHINNGLIYFPIFPPFFLSVALYRSKAETNTNMRPFVYEIK